MWSLTGTMVSGWDLVVAHRYKGERPGGVERGWGLVVAHRYKGERPGDVER